MTLGPNYHHSNRMYAANQIGVATTLPQSSEVLSAQQLPANNIDHDHARSTHSNHSQDERFYRDGANVVNCEVRFYNYTSVPSHTLHTQFVVFIYVELVLSNLFYLDKIKRIMTVYK